MKKSVFVVLAVAFVLSACSTETKRKLGLANQAPDEFMVMSRAPLSLPPEYGLRPVRDMSGMQQVDMSERMSGMDLSEQKLMAKIDAAQTDANIKAKLEQDFRELNAEK